MVKRKIKKHHFWEIVIVSIILLIIIYRVALAYGYVPEEYRPSVVMGEAYVGFKKDLRHEVSTQGSFRYPAKWTLDNLEASEDYINKRKLRWAQNQEAAERCDENIIFRYFMYIGREDNMECTQQRTVLHEETRKINESVQRNKDKN